MARVANQHTGFASSCSLNKAFIDLYQYRKVLRYMLAFENIASLFYLLIHLIPLGRTSGGGVCHLPLGGLFELFPVFSSFSFTSRAHFETSLVMVSYYVYEIWRHKLSGGKAIFEWKYMFFQLLSAIKVKLVDEMMQSAYLCGFLHVTRKKYHLSGINLNSNSWV